MTPISEKLVVKLIDNAFKDLIGLKGKKRKNMIENIKALIAYRVIRFDLAYEDTATDDYIDVGKDN